MSKLTAFLGVARAPFLLLPVVLVAAGASAAAWDGAFSWYRTFWALVGLVALHVAVNSLNEASDMRTGIDLRTTRTPFSGGSGTLPSGVISPRAAEVLGWSGALVGLAIGVWFVFVVGRVMIPILLIGAVTVIFYTNVLARAGVGEFAAGLGLGGLPVLGTAIVQNGTFGPAAMVAAVPAFFMTFNLLLLNEFPDEQADREGGRRNLVLIFGRPAAAKIYALAAILTPIAIATGVLGGALPPLALLAVLPSLFLVKPLQWAFSRPDAPVPIPALGANVAWNLATNALLAIGLTIAVFMRGGV